MSLIGRSMAAPMVLAFTAVAALAIVASPEPMAASTAQPFPFNRAVADNKSEVRRIHAHFDSVLVELEATDVAALSDAVRANRTRLVQTLRGYNARAEFPHNYDFVNPTPYFVDRKTGTLCAVAFLLESTGRRDIVNRIAGANNNVWVAELKSDSALASWLRVQGITLDEAARIQVPYEDGSSDVRIATYVIGAPLVMGTAIATATWNAWGNRNGHNRFGTHAGLVSGAATAGLGAFLVSNLGNAKDGKAVGVGIAAVGTVSMGLAVRALTQRPRYLAARREKESTRRANVDASISPILPIGKDAGAGLSMSIRF